MDFDDDREFLLVLLFLSLYDFRFPEFLDLDLDLLLDREELDESWESDRFFLGKILSNAIIFSNFCFLSTIEEI